MMENNSDELTSFFRQNKFPAHVYGECLKKMEKVNKKSLKVLLNVCEFKNPKYALFLSILFGYLGVDRFFLQHYFKGSVKAIVTILSVFLGFYFNFSFIWLVLLIPLKFWIIDLFKIYSDTRMENFYTLECNLLCYLEDEESMLEPESKDEIENPFFKKKTAFYKSFKTKAHTNINDEKMKQYEEEIRKLTDEKKEIRKEVIVEFVKKMRENGIEEDKIDKIVGDNIDVI